jgi:CheY-like chemotaxis protein
VLVLQPLLGIAADSAANGVDALAAWARGRYAAVLADIHMPTVGTSSHGGCAPPKPIGAPPARRSLRSLPTP